MSEAAAAALASVRAFLGDDRLTDPDNMAAHFTVRAYEDSWLVTPARNGRGGHLFLVCGARVLPFQLARTTLPDAYAELQRAGA